MKWQICLHLNLMKFGKSSLLMQSNPSSVELMVQPSPSYWDVSRLHPMSPQVRDSWILFLPWCWFLTCSEAIIYIAPFVSPPYLLLPELSICWFGTGFLSCCSACTTHNWLGLMGFSSISLLKAQSEWCGSPHRKPVCNLLLGRTHSIQEVQSRRQMDVLEGHHGDKKVHPSEMNVCSCLLYSLPSIVSPSRITLSSKIWWLGWVL